MFKGKWWRLPRSMAMTDAEYDANIRGLNILFGAVLGFVLAGTTNLPPLDFAFVLLLSATSVGFILYLSQSDYKLFYGLLTAIIILAIPDIIVDVMKFPAIPQLQPTLAVWAIMVAVVEMMPRNRASNPSEKNT